jgi:glycosyltransferase involved in cell wall biosynthesis
MPDATLGWVPYALAEGHRILETHRFHAILSSAGPPSSHIVGGRLQRRSGLPWIADYRDLWSDNHWDHRIAPFRAAERAFERRIVRPARHLTTVAPTWAERLEALHGKPATVILNGFDPADYPDEPATPREPGLTLTYVGTLYWPGQSPEPLFAAIERLARGPDGQDLEAVGFRARFLGTQPGLVESLARSYDVQRWVERTPRVPHPESLARQRASAALLYIGWQEPAEGFLTAKIFEYLGANRPILAVGPPGGPASELLRECGLPDLTDDPVRIAQRLKGWIREFRSTGSLAASTDEVAIARYTRRTQTERLARLLDEVVS